MSGVDSAAIIFDGSKEEKKEKFINKKIQRDSWHEYACTWLREATTRFRTK